MAKAVLTLLQSAKLVNLIEAEFSSARCDDAAFAKLATEKLGFAVNDLHVGTRRRQLDIPSYEEARLSEKETTIAARVKRLEEGLAAIRRDFDALAEALGAKGMQ